MRGQALNAAAGIAALGAALWKPISGAIAFESAMADVSKVVDFKDAAAFQTFQQAIRDLSEIPGMPAANDLAAIAAAAGQAGIAGDDLTRFTEVAAKVGTAFDIGADEAGDALAKLMTGLGLTIPEVTNLSDAMNHLSNAQASSAAEILDVVRRVGAQAKQYGFTAEQVSAFASAMIASGAESEVAATSFRNMGMALTRGASATKRQSAALKDLGLDAVDVAKRMQKDAVGTTVDVLERISKLPKEVQAAVSSDLFGNEARALGPLLTNLDLVRDSIGLVSDQSQYAGSAFSEFERRAATFGEKLKAFSHSLENLGTVVGTTLFPVLTDLMNRLAPIIAAVGDWTAANPRLVSGIIATTGALLGFKLALAGLRLVGLMSMGGYLKSVSFGFGTIGAQASRIGGAARESMRLNAALAGMQGVQVGKLGQIGAALRGISFAVVGISAGAFGMIAGGVAAVAAAGYLLWKHWDRVKAIASGVGRAVGEALQPALEKLRPVLEPLAPAFRAIVAGLDALSDAMHTAVGWVSNLFGSLGEREVLTADQEQAAEQRAYEIARKIIGALTGLRGQLVDLGTAAIQGLWDGMTARFAGLLEWVRGLPARIREAMPRISLPFGLGGGGGGPEQSKAAGGWVSPGGVRVGERGEERLYASQAGFIAHHRAVRQMAAMASRVSIPQPRALAVAAGGPRGGGPVNVSFGDIVIQGGAGASADELRSAFGREATAALRSAFADTF
ncbi:MAG: phage tail tape measure protein [Amaricoccus sp.]|uniref:phage tail tape measure protein n=1 Tax=Amaricoccus sp. TaxID=1872485 RepID=UPI0039E71B01